LAFGVTANGLERRSTPPTGITPRTPMQGTRRSKLRLGKVGGFLKKKGVETIKKARGGEKLTRMETSFLKNSGKTVSGAIRLGSNTPISLKKEKQKLGVAKGHIVKKKGRTLAGGQERGGRRRQKVTNKQGQKATVVCQTVTMPWDWTI